MRKTLATDGILGLALVFAPITPLAAQDTVKIPLQGTLEPRCNARVHDLTVTPGEDLKVVLYIDHSCNSGHVLLLKVLKGSGADLSNVKVTYAGRDPTHKGEDDATFRYGKPVTMTGTMTIEVENPTEEQRQAILESLNVQVLPD